MIDLFTSNFVKPKSSLKIRGPYTIAGLSVRHPYYNIVHYTKVR